ncbi:MAG: HAD family hydrolase [Candidatus Fermentibacteraceae bacterium]|nr:HAD family hydrolase [Candidatus Fermentibacteraceae bacterium]
MKKLAVFDLDGTLHHTELALAPAIAKAAADITGKPEPPYETVNSLYGEPLEMFCKVLVGTEEPDVCKRFVDLVQLHQARTLPTDGKLYPGVIEMLQKLRSMVFDLAVLSNAHMQYLELVTKTLGIGSMFVRLVGRTDEASKTARLAELSRGYDFTVMIGDRYHDIQAGLENSLPVIACSYGYGSAQEHRGSVCVDSAEQIVPVIQKMLSEIS